MRELLFTDGSCPSLIPHQVQTSALENSLALDYNQDRPIKKSGISEQSHPGYKLKHKTEMCRNWENGDCPYGTQCAYAHGNDELLKKRHVPTKYKTRLCK